MDAIAIILISSGVWVSYCGAYGIPPIETLVQIVQSPNNARQIITDAKTATAARLAQLGVTATTAGLVAPAGAKGGNPFAGFNISSSYADHLSRGTHGIDYSMPVGTPLPSPIDGTAEVVPNDGDYGNRVTIRGNGIVSNYGHLSSFSVQNGQAVKKGQIVGLSGGEAGAAGAGNSTGPHLHWSITVGGISRDPSAYFESVSNA